MFNYIPDIYIDYTLLAIKETDIVSVCSSQPTTFYNAYWPSLWLPQTNKSLSDLVHPPTNNGFIYECIISGTSGISEPSWGTSQDEEFFDGTIKWKTHINYSLAIYSVLSSEMTFTSFTGGKRLTISGRANVTAHATGTVSCVALINTIDRTLRFAHTSYIYGVDNNLLLKGRTLQVNTFNIDRMDLI